MIMPARVRTFALTVHVASSVGWLGAVAVFLTLAVIALTSRDEQTVRGVYLVMEPAARLILLPLGVASLLTGIVQGAMTRWGLFRNYWVVLKLGITLVSTIVLWTYMDAFRYMATMAADPGADLAMVRNPSPALHAGLALLALLVAVTLSVYKPRGVTRYGRRKQQGQLVRAAAA